MFVPLARGNAFVEAAPERQSQDVLNSAAGPWRYALSADRRWALVYDAAGRNLAEVHRPALATGPNGRQLTFDNVVRLMSVAPDLLALLQETVAPGGIGPHEYSRPGGYRERAQAVIALLLDAGIG